MPWLPSGEEALFEVSCWNLKSQRCVTDYGIFQVRFICVVDDNGSLEFQNVVSLSHG